MSRGQFWLLTSLILIIMTSFCWTGYQDEKQAIDAIIARDGFVAPINLPRPEFLLPPAWLTSRGHDE